MSIRERFHHQGVSLVTAILLSAVFSVASLALGPVNNASATCSQAIYNAYYNVSAYAGSTYSSIDLNGASAGSVVGLPSSQSAYETAITPNGSQLFVAGTNRFVTVLDTATNTTSQIAIGATNTSWAVAINNAGTTAYVTDYTGAQLEVIDIATLTLTTSISLPGTNPTSIVVTPNDNQVWVRFNGTNGIAIIDATTSSVVDGDANTAGTQTFFAGSTTSTVNQGQGLSINPSGTRVVASNYYSGTISLIDVTNMTMIDVNGASAGLNTATTGGQTVRRVFFSPDGSHIFALHTPFSGSASYVQVFTADLSSYADITAVSYPIDMAFLNNGHIAVGNFTGNTIAIFEATGGSSTWNGPYTQIDADSVTAGVQGTNVGSTVYTIEYGCASSLISTTTSSSTTSTTATSTTSTTVAPTTSTSTPSTTSTTLANGTSTTIASNTTTPVSNSGTTSTTQPTPMNTATSTTVTSNTSTTSTSMAPPTSTTALATTTTVASPTLTPEEIKEFLGIDADQVASITTGVEDASGAVALVNGKVIKVDVKTTLSSVTLAHSGATLEMKCFDSTGTEIGLSGESRFELRRGDTVQISVTGFAPMAVINAAVFSDPTALGTLTADAYGNGMEKWAVPDTIVAGNHTLMVAGDLAKVKDTVFGLRIIVDQESFAARVAGSWVTRLILLFGIVLGFFIPATLRRRRAEEE